jgi:hypothetical protein
MSKGKDSVQLAIALQALAAKQEVLSIALQEALRTLGSLSRPHVAGVLDKKSSARR